MKRVPTDRPTDRPTDPVNACSFCTWTLVAKTTERQVRRRGRGRAVRQFCCAVCGRYLETPVSRRHELVWKRRPKPGALPDQDTIFDSA